MKKIFPLIVPIMLLLVGVVNAQTQLPDPGILPDNPFYGFKKAFEAIGNAFTFGEEAKAERALKLAEKRLAEAEAIAKKGKPEFVDELSQEYEKQIKKANEIATLAKGANKKEQLAELVSKATSQHLSALDEVQERVPEQAKEKIAAVREISIRGNQEALKALARENPEKAAEIAMNIAQSRANKAKVAAEEGDEEKTIEAAKEYEKYAMFGEEISSIAQQVGKDSSKVEELVAKATSLHITVLEDVLEKVSEQAQSTIQGAIEASETGRDAAVDALEEKGLPIPKEVKEKLEVEIPEEASEQIEKAVESQEKETPADIPLDIPGGRP